MPPNAFDRLPQDVLAEVFWQLALLHNEFGQILVQLSKVRGVCRRFSYVIDSMEPLLCTSSRLASKCTIHVSFMSKEFKSKHYRTSRDDDMDMVNLAASLPVDGLSVEDVGLVEVDLTCTKFGSLYSGESTVLKFSGVEYQALFDFPRRNSSESQRELRISWAPWQVNPLETSYMATTAPKRFVIFRTYDIDINDPPGTHYIGDQNGMLLEYELRHHEKTVSRMIPRAGSNSTNAMVALQANVVHHQLFVKRVIVNWGWLLSGLAKKPVDLPLRPLFPDAVELFNQTFASYQKPADSIIKLDRVNWSCEMILHFMARYFDKVYCGDDRTFDFKPLLNLLCHRIHTFNGMWHRRTIISFLLEGKFDLRLITGQAKPNQVSLQEYSDREIYWFYDKLYSLMKSRTMVMKSFGPNANVPEGLEKEPLGSMSFVKFDTIKVRHVLEFESLSGSPTFQRLIQSLVNECQGMYANLIITNST